MGPEHRRHHRYNTAMEVMVIERNKARAMRVENVSFDGMLAISDVPPPIRTLLRLELGLPSDGQPIRLTAMAVYESEPDDNGEYRIGIQLFGLEPTTRQRWDRFIVELRSGDAKEYEPPTKAAPPKPPQPPSPPRDTSRRPTILQAGPPELRIALDSSEAVEMVCAQIRENAELFVRTDVRIGLGQEIWVSLFHPATARSISIPARVRQQHVSSEFIGLSVRCIIDETERAALADFEMEHISITIELEGDDLMGLDELTNLHNQTRAPLEVGSDSASQTPTTVVPPERCEHSPSAGSD